MGENRYFFDSAMNDHYIHFFRNGDMCWIEDYYMDDNPKTFFVLLRSAITTLSEKGIKKFQQMISNDDWNKITKQLNKSNVKILKNDLKTESKLIECELEFALDILYLGFITE